MKKENAHSETLPYLGNISVGVTLGTDPETDVPIFQFNEDRYRHTLIVGRTGSGKSNHIQQLEREDIRNGAGVFILAAHAEDALYPLSCVPEERMDDVVLIDATNARYLPRLNPLDVDRNDKLALGKAISDCIELLTDEERSDWSGPRFNQWVRMGLQLMLQPRCPLPASLGVLQQLFTDPDLVGEYLHYCDDEALYNQWRNEAAAHKSSDHEDTIQWFLGKVNRFVVNPTLAHVFGPGPSTIDMARIVQEGKILIAVVPEELIGHDAACTISKWLIMQLKDAILGRGKRLDGELDDRDADLGFFGGTLGAYEQLDPFFVYIDEFAKHATPDFAPLLAQSRKFHVGFVLSLQTMDQADVVDPTTGKSSRLLNSVLGNVGSIIVYPVSIFDAKLLANQFDVSCSEMLRNRCYEPLARLTLDSHLAEPITLQVPLRPEAEHEDAPWRIARQQIEKGIWFSTEPDPSAEKAKLDLAALAMDMEFAA